MECQYCQKILKNKYILKNHQKTAKGCLSLRGLQPEFKCKACNEVFTTRQNLQRHQDTCLEFACQQRLQEELPKYFKLIDKLKDTIKGYQTDIQNLTNAHELEIKELKLEHEKELRRVQVAGKDEVIEIAKNSTLTIQNTNTKNINNYFDNVAHVNLEELKIESEAFVTKHDIGNMKSNKKIMQLYCDEVLKDPSSLKYRIVCSDPSRLMFKYKDTDGNIIRDPRMEKLVDVIHHSIERPIREVMAYKMVEEKYPLYDDDTPEEREQKAMHNLKVAIENYEVKFKQHGALKTDIPKHCSNILVS